MDESETSTLASSMAEVARLLQQAEGVDETWAAITLLAVERLDSVDHAGITIVRGGQPKTPAASDELPGKVDQLQYALREGPCLSSIAEHETFRSDDLAGETARWPKFGVRAATELGVHSMLSFRLFVQEDTLGALNFYSHRAAAFDDTVLDAGTVFAAHASLALSNAREHEKAAHLERALDSNRLIGAACGILMARHHITEEQAFEVLRRFSQDNNRKIRDVADDVLQAGTMPEAPPRRKH